jgi:hypothetical protein
MFTIDKKEYDETKLDDKGKVAFNNVKVLAKEKENLLHSLEKNKILSEHYSKVKQKNSAKIGDRRWLQKLK